MAIPQSSTRQHVDLGEGGEQLGVASVAKVDGEVAEQAWQTQARTVSRVMDEAGIRRSRRVRDFQLDTLLFDGPAYQDWAATHVSLRDDHARVRIYAVETGASPGARFQAVTA